MGQTQDWPEGDQELQGHLNGGFRWAGVRNWTILPPSVCHLRRPCQKECATLGQMSPSPTHPRAGSRGFGGEHASHWRICFHA